MKIVMVTRSEPVGIEDEKHCSMKCLHYDSHIPRCDLFQVDIPLDEEDRRPRRVHACRTSEERYINESERDRLIQTLVDTSNELADLF